MEFFLKITIHNKIKTIKYLGINVTKDVQGLHNKKNYKILLRETGEN